MKWALTGTCVVVLLAVAYLSLSLIVLQPPHASFAVWFAVAAVVTVESTLTLAVVHTSTPPPALRAVAIFGATATVGIALWRLRTTLVSAHFEGYDVLFGAMLAVQGVLTIIVLARPSPPSVSAQVGAG